MSVNCCYQCNNRHQGCHSTCIKYINEKKIHDTNTKLERKEKNKRLGGIYHEY